MLRAGVIRVVPSIGTGFGVKTQPGLKRSVETQVRVAGFVVTVLVLLPFLEQSPWFWAGAEGISTRNAG